jgi:hypothetical protein
MASLVKVIFTLVKLDTCGHHVMEGQNCKHNEDQSAQFGCFVLEYIFINYVQPHASITCTIMGILANTLAQRGNLGGTSQMLVGYG